MSEPDDDGKVIAADFAAAPKPDGPSVLRPTRRPSPSFTRVTMGGKVLSCGHGRVSIDETTLDMECEDYKEPIDARLYVLEWARRLRRLEWSREEVSKLNDEASRLKNEIRNLKAQKRRAERTP